MKKRVLATALAAAMAGSMLAGFTTQEMCIRDRPWGYRTGGRYAGYGRKMCAV